MALALANYTDLQATALDFMDRVGVTRDVDAAPAWVLLAEGRLNREIGAVETDTTLTGTIDSRRIDITSASCVQPIALYLAESGLNERKVTLQADGTFPYISTSGRPAFAAVDRNAVAIDFDRPLDAAYPFRFRHRTKFNLASSSTNWLLTNHPDVYLAATMMWGAGYHEDWPGGAGWKLVLDEAIPSIKNQIAANKRGVSTVDPGLLQSRHVSAAEIAAGDF